MPKHALMHSPAWLSRIPVVTGTAPTGMLWKEPVITVPLARLVYVVPELTEYQRAQEPCPAHLITCMPSALPPTFTPVFPAVLKHH